MGCGKSVIYGPSNAYGACCIDRNVLHNLRYVRRLRKEEFVKNFSLMCDEALGQPLIITRHGRDGLVVLSLARYRELTNTLDRAKQAPERTGSLRNIVCPKLLRQTSPLIIIHYTSAPPASKALTKLQKADFRKIESH